MTKSVVSKGKTIEEAVGTGLSLLQAKEDEVEIEVLQNDEKGVLGFGKKQAIVRLTQFSDEQVQTPEENAAETAASPENKNVQTQQDEPLSGVAWVSGGKIYCRTDGNEYPIVQLTQGLTVLKNNHRVTETSLSITEQDELAIHFNTVELETEWDIAMGKDKLNVILSVTPGYTITRSLEDAAPSQELQLKTIETKIINNTMRYEKIMMKLEMLHVRYGFNQIEIVKALEAIVPSTYEIATGLPPVQGENGYVEYRVEMEVKHGPRERTDGSMDFREIKAIPAVSNGQVLAVVYPPVPGTPGVTVTNEPLPPNPALPIVIKERKGVMAVESDDHISLIATESGRPFIEIRGLLATFMIMPKMVHRGNVDLASGNLRFQGDIEVFGEITERMEVEAKGNITVHENVYKGKLTSSGSIVTKGNVIGSDFTAGKSNMVIVNLGRSLSDIAEQFNHMLFLIRQLKNSDVYQNTDFEEKDLKPVIFILIEKKFPSLPIMIKRFHDSVRENQMIVDEEWGTIADLLNHCCVPLNKDPARLKKFVALSEKMKEWITLSTTQVEPDAYITLPFVMNSNLYCSGDVFINGQGCYNTKIHASGFLEVIGVLRGGEVYGKTGVKVHDAGSEGRVATSLSVPIDQKIWIDQAMEGTVLKVGPFKHTIEDEQKHICAYVEDDQLFLR